MATTSSPLPLPEIDSDEPVAVIPAASVAPLDGRPDGERINIYTVVPKSKGSVSNSFSVEVRERVLAQPLTYAAIAFSLGFVIARLLR
jgi:hypothetical protein